MVHFALAFLLLVLVGCRQAEVIDACSLGAEYCPSCITNEECLFSGNACTEAVYCAHQEAGVSVVQIGCDEALEYAWPDDSACQCQAGACAAVE
jgi:hypothetical protein